MNFWLEVCNKYCYGEFWNYNNNHDFNGLVNAITSKFEVVGEGSNRISVSRNKDFVIKIPKNTCGLTDNWHEASVRNVIYCKARLYCNVLLVMTKVTYVKHEELPQWANRIDCQQVGKTKYGKIKAYDFGLC